MDQVEADDLRQEFSSTHSSHVQPIRSCTPGLETEVLGTVKSISIRPQDKVPAFEIELYDGSGSVKVIWLGRRKIPGIVTGRRLIVSGRLTCNTDDPTIFNPKYELRPLRR